MPSLPVFGPSMDDGHDPEVRVEKISVQFWPPYVMPANVTVNAESSTA